VGVLADSPLFLRVQKPSGTGELEPMILSERRAGHRAGPSASLAPSEWGG